MNQQPTIDPVVGETEARLKANALASAYKDALECQDACNLSGIVYTLAKHLPTLWAEANEKGLGTDSTNRHSVVQLFLSKLVSLAGGYHEPPIEAWDICEERKHVPHPFEIYCVATDEGITRCLTEAYARDQARILTENKGQEYSVRKPDDRDYHGQ
jgi:hypothetical protein